MKRKQATAAKAAEKKNDGGAGAPAELAAIVAGKWPHWRMTTRKGERVLIDPHGHIYHGTAQDVRAAALTPIGREGLAHDIKWARHVAERLNYTPEERREYVSEKRRDAIRKENHFVLFGEQLAIPADVYILLRAGARLVRDNFDAFLEELWEAEISALLDVAESETGKREIPLTRYERAAIDRIRATRPQIEAEAKARLATA